MSPRNNTAADIEAQIGERIRSRRIQVGMSQILLGEALGVTFQQVQKYEKGANRVSAGRLLKIAEVLECDIVNFYKGLRSDRSISDSLFSQFLSTKEGVAIVEAMLRIRSQEIRRTVIDIAGQLADVTEKLADET
jgi:transcriptional regulator with XRE-family HTH domain